MNLLHQLVREQHYYDLLRESNRQRIAIEAVRERIAMQVARERQIPRRAEHFLSQWLFRLGLWIRVQVATI